MVGYGIKLISMKIIFPMTDYGSNPNFLCAQIIIGSPTEFIVGVILCAIITRATEYMKRTNEIRNYYVLIIRPLSQDWEGFSMTFQSPNSKGMILSSFGCLRALFSESLNGSSENPCTFFAQGYTYFPHSHKSIIQAISYLKDLRSFGVCGFWIGRPCA